MLPSDCSPHQSETSLIPFCVPSSETGQKKTFLELLVVTLWPTLKSTEYTPTQYQYQPFTTLYYKQSYYGRQTGCDQTACCQAVNILSRLHFLLIFYRTGRFFFKAKKNKGFIEMFHTFSGQLSDCLNFIFIFGVKIILTTLPDWIVRTSNWPL